MSSTTELLTKAETLLSTPTARNILDAQWLIGEAHWNSATVEGKTACEAAHRRLLETEVTYNAAQRQGTPQ